VAEWTPLKTHCYSENLVVPEIELGNSVSAAMKSDHEITDARKTLIIIIEKMI
jgi:hypothetical protein